MKTAYSWSKTIAALKGGAFRRKLDRPVLLLVGVAVLVLVALAWAAGEMPGPLASFLALAALGITFNSVPSNLRIPFVTAEFDSSRAQQGPALLAYRALLVGQKIAAGTGTADAIYKVSSAADVLTLAGQGSLLHRMAKAWFDANASTECYVGVLADNGAGVVASGTLTFTGPATAAGTLNVYIGGDRIQVPITTGMTAAQAASALVAALTVDLPLTGAVGGVGSEHIVTLTCRHKGEVGNDIDIRLNYQDGETTPAGLGVTIVAMTGGTTNPVLTTLIAAMGDLWYNVIAFPYTDATSLSAIEAELASRWGPMRMIDGVAITAKSGSWATATAASASRNSKHVCMVGVNASPTPGYEIAAHVAGTVAYYGCDAPARPFQTLPLTWVKAPAEASRWTIQERNLALYAGLATLKVGSGSVVQVERLITTYQTNAAGADDTAYLDLNTPLTLMYLRYSWRTLIATRFPRHSLANDGTRVGAGSAVVTPKMIKAEAVGWFRQMERRNLVENFDQFVEDLVVERNDTDPNRVDILLAPDIINQLVVTAAKIQFLL